MILAVAFLNALLGTAIIGAGAKYLIDLFSAHHPARFGGFCVALGFAIGRMPSSIPLDERGWITASAVLGTLVALLGLWRWLMKKPGGVEVGDSGQ